MAVKQKATRIRGVREVKEKLSHFIKESRKESIIITSHGKFEAILFNVENKDPEDVILFTSNNFQKAINYRDNERISFTKAKKLLLK